MASLTSTEPATGETLWTGETGDVEAAVAAARAAWAGWASRSFAYRVETLRRMTGLLALKQRSEREAYRIGPDTRLDPEPDRQGVAASPGGVGHVRVSRLSPRLGVP